MKKFIISIFFIFLISLPSYSSSRWSMEITGGRDLVFSNTISKNWDHGWSVSLGFLYKIHPQLKLTFGVGYHYFKLHIVNWGAGGWPTSLVLDRLEGNDTRMYDFSFGFNSYNSVNLSGIYASARSGICYVEYGRIDEYTYFFWEPDVIYKNISYGTNELRPFISMSLGYDMKITSRLHLKIEGGMMTAFKRECSFIPAKIAFEYMF
ncbi:hypothetical protein JXA84_09910 [candidate division WOR-3 bacterium]|nr:hypothetical protein [candidate division WOR-3 bacterium]